MKSNEFCTWTEETKKMNFLSKFPKSCCKRFQSTLIDGMMRWRRSKHLEKNETNKKVKKWKETKKNSRIFKRKKEKNSKSNFLKWLSHFCGAILKERTKRLREGQKDRRTVGHRERQGHNDGD